MIKAPCVVKYHTFQDNNGYVVKTWYIEDAAGEPWADDACESDCREIADALNDAARYRQALEKAHKELDPALFFSAIGYMAAACRVRYDIAAALADAGKGGGE